MYYELNESVISDAEYDKISKQLVNMQNEAGGTLKETQYFIVCMISMVLRASFIPQVDKK